MRRTLRALSCAIVFVLGLAALPAAQRTIDEPASIDFYAIGADGPVFDLRQDEVVLKVDGRVRQVRSLRYIPLPLASPGSLPGETPVELESPFGTNVTEPEGRWLTIVLDQETIRPGAERNALHAVIRLVNQLGPKDRVSLVKMPNGGIEVDFTDRHATVVDALRKFVGRAPREATERDRSCNSRLLLNTMRDYYDGLAQLEGAKQVVLVSSGMLNPRRDAPLDAPPGPCEILMLYFQEVALAASRARVSTIVVQPDDVTMDPARQAFVDRTASRFSAADQDRAGLESFAGVTGGDFTRVVGPDDNTLVNLFKASAGYYIATFSPSGGERNGAPHRVEVSVKRDRVRIRARPEVFIPRSRITRAADVSARDMIRNGILYRALPLRVLAFPSAGREGKVKVLAVVEPVEPNVRFAEAVFGLIDSRERLVAQWTANERELTGVPLVTAGEAAPGAYRLRVAVIDAEGRRGSAEFEFLGRLSETEPVSMSALALGVSRDSGFVPKLVFGSDQAAVGYFEIYGKTARPDAVTVRLEAAAAPEGRALLTAPARVINQRDDRRLAVGALPIASLPPGEYVIRAIVSVEGRPVGRVSRTLRKSPTGA